MRSERRGGVALDPIFRLRVRTAHLELRMPTDEELRWLASAAVRARHNEFVHDFHALDCANEYTDFEQAFVSYYGDRRPQRNAAKGGQLWQADLGVFVNGEPVGIQGFYTRRFNTSHSVETYSWLGLSHQHRGLGKQMRAAVLGLVFDHLGVQTAVSGARFDNGPSQAVSRRFDYTATGTYRRKSRLGQDHHFERYVLARSAWDTLRQDWPAVTVGGASAFMAHVGMQARTPPTSVHTL